MSLYSAVLLALITAQLAAQDSRPQSVPAGLIARLRAPGFAERRDAVRACRGHAEPEVQDALRDRVRHDDHPNIRAFALEELIAMRPPDLFALARGVLAQESNPYPREVALHALGASRDPAAYDLLVPLLDGNDGAHAARGLAALGDARAFAPIAELLGQKASDVRVGELVPQALVALDHDRGVDRLLELFGRDEALARACAPVLAQEPLPRVRKAMLGLLASPALGVRHAAVRVLGGIADVTCLDQLLAVFDRDAELREACALALARSGLSLAARPLCERLLADENPRARSAIAGALRSLKDPGIVPDLQKILGRETDDLVRVQLVAALGSQGDRHAVATLMALLDDPAVTRQPPQLSRILRFPHNVRLGDVAVWAAASLVDGREPFAVDQLSSFPAPAPAQACAAARARLQAWWQALADKAPYTRSR